MNFRLPNKNILFCTAIIIIVGVSYFFYGPYNALFYNSDNAIHVLMTADFQLPRDYYYWGQNRLGSLLPMCAFLLGKIVNLHPLYLCAITHYLFLFSGFYILSKSLTATLSKITLCAIIFLPISEYTALTLIGHPYSSQFFAGSVCFYFLSRLRKYILENEIIKIKRFFICVFYGAGGIIFFILGVWVSEFNVILLVIPLFYLGFDVPLRIAIFTSIKKVWLILFLLFSSLFAISGSGLYWWAKYSASDQATDNYGEFFLTNMVDIEKNFFFFLSKLATSFLFMDDSFIGNFFNWTLIILTLIVITNKVFKLFIIKQESKVLLNSLILFCLVSSLLLFLSSWNFRSEFSPRYFTPVYVVFCFAIILFLDLSIVIKKTVSQLFCTSICLCCFTYCYQTSIKHPFQSTMNKYSAFKTLPTGTLIGEYWDVYKINSIAINNLKSIPFDYEMVRNWNWKEKTLSSRNFYFLDDNIVAGQLNEFIFQHGKIFKFSGKKFRCNNIDVWLYHKVVTKPIVK